MASFMDRVHHALSKNGGFTAEFDTPRARLEAYMAREGDADRAQFAALIDALIAEAVKEERRQRLADHRTWQHDLGTLRTAQKENGRLRDENAALQQRLHDAAMAKVWKNEDGKKFVFVEDVFPALLGIEPKEPRP